MITIKNNIANTTYTEQVTDESVKIILIQNGTQKRFLKAPVLSYSSVEKKNKKETFKVADNRRRCEIVIKDADITQPFILNGTLEEGIIITKELSNCIDNIPVYLNKKDMQNANLVITANENCEFNKPPLFVYYTENGYRPYSFTLSKDKKTATLQKDITKLYDIDTFGEAKVKGKADVKEIITKSYGTVNVYIVDIKDLEKFSKTRFNNENTDLGTFVNRIHKLYINVPVLTTDVITCGKFNTLIQVKAPTSDVITVKCGKVKLPLHNNDITDFNSEIKVFLPFIGYKEISAEYSGKTISLEYKINIIVGDGIAILKCNDNIIDVYDCTPSSELLYHTADKQQLRPYGGETWRVRNMYGLQPYVLYKWYSSKDDTVIKQVKERMKINEVKGYATIDEVDNIKNDQITLDEKTLIYDLLKKGIRVLK